MALSVKVDALVIGAGIIGASCAFRLSERGVKVAVLEAQRSPAMGSTAQSAAGVRIQFTEETNIRLSWESIQEYQHFHDLYGEDAEYQPIGYLFLVPPERWAVHLDGVRLQERIGAPVRVLSVEDAQSLVQFDPSGIAPLTKADRVDNVWQVETPKGVFEADYLVNTAGAWAGEVARRAGLEVPVYPLRRMIYATAPTVWQHSYPLTIDLTSGFYLRSERERILFGRSNPDEPPGFTEGIDWEWFESTISVGLERFPWLAETRLDRHACWWGYYEVTPDHNPILGRMPASENWVNAAGFSGHGVQQAPTVGRLIAEEVTLGKAQSLNIDALRINRFSAPQQHQEHNIV